MDTASLLELLSSVSIYLGDRADIIDTAYGPTPNLAASLQADVDEAIKQLERQHAATTA